MDALKRRIKRIEEIQQRYSRDLRRDPRDEATEFLMESAMDTLDRLKKELI